MRALGLERTGLVVGLAITTVAFFFLARHNRGGVVLGGVFLEIMLISVVQEGITKRERLLFSSAAAALGFAALVLGTLSS